MGEPGLRPLVDEDVSAAIQPDGGLYDLGWYLSWVPGRDEATLDGYFTARQLRAIADHMDPPSGARSA